jgi:hypothetical protein
VTDAVRELGRLLGLAAHAPQATQGEHDVLWELAEPGRRLVFEIKLAPDSKTIAIKDVNQAEGATRAVQAEHPGAPVRGVIVTPHDTVEPKALVRLELVRLLALADLQAFTSQLLTLLGVYANGWSEDAATREHLRNEVEPQLPDLELLWKRRKDPKDSPWVALSRKARG